MKDQNLQKASRREDERIVFIVFGIGTLLWLVAFLPQWLFWMSADILGLFATLGGIVGAFGWTIGAIMLRSMRMLIVGFAMAVLCGAVTQGVPEQILARVTLANREERYLSVVKSPPEISTEIETGEQVLIDKGNGNLKVGFLFGNVLYNDGAIVYDPAREMIRPGRTHPMPIFGGTLAGVQHLRGPWYYCRLILD